MPQKYKKLTLSRFKAATLAAFIVCSFGVASIANADIYDQQIAELNAQNNQAQNALNSLYAEATSFQAAINQLNAQINAVQTQIAANEAEQVRINTEIAANEADIATKRTQIAASIKAMYLDGDMSTIEQLATSKSLSEYIDKEEYRTAVQKQLDEKIKEIKELQVKLADQKAQVEQLIASQKVQREQLAVAQAEQSRLLAFNQGQQDAFNSQIASNSSRIKELRAAQAAENARLAVGNVIGGQACDSGNGDTYPYRWCSAPLDAYVDNWGMYTRECVSYTAWKVYESGRNMPNWGGIGNAWQWAFSGWKYRDGTRANGNYAGTTWHRANSEVAGIPTDNNPRSGDVAISANGSYGHAMYVEHVYGDGSILVSDYNQQWDGAYRKYTISRASVVSKNLRFIHF